jgi:hypothetical protein
VVALLCLFAWHEFLQATDLTGTFHQPDGTPVNGKLIFLLSQPARLSDNSAQVVPMVKIFSVTNGQLEPGAFIYGNDVLVPAGTHYLVRLVDDSNNLLFEQKWSIQGTTLDLGTMTPTTTGVVLPDPLVKNVTTDQAVQGPVTFSSGITAASLLLSGNLGPTADGVFDLGTSALQWREIFAQQWAGRVVPGATGGLVTPTPSAPGTAQEATTGGSIADGTYYCVTTLVNLNGETTASPEKSQVISAGTGTARMLVVATGREWATGAFGFKVYCGTTSGGPYYEQVPQSRTFTLDNNSVSRDANGFVTLTRTGTSMGIADGDEITISGATGCTNNPNGTFRIYSHVAGTGSSTFTFKHAGATESGCGGASIVVSIPTGFTSFGTGSATHLVNAHLVRGDVILTAIAGSGDTPPSTNTATIDALQVAINSARVASTLAAGQAVRVNKAVQLTEGNSTISGFTIYAPTTPIILSTGDRLYGQAGPQVSASVNSGSQLDCRLDINALWDDVYDKIGCIMVINSTGTVIENVNIRSVTHGLRMFHSNSDSSATNYITFRNGTWTTSGTGAHCPAPLRIEGRYYYFKLDNVELNPSTITDCFATSGHPRGAALMLSNMAGGNQHFVGESVRWTIPAKHDAIQNRGGVTDPDRGIASPGFVARADVWLRGVQFQHTAGGGTGVTCRCLDTSVKATNISSADLNVSAGTDANWILGHSADGLTASLEFISSSIGAIANNAAAIQFRGVGGERLVLISSSISNAPTNIIDLNNLNIAVMAVASDTSGASVDGLCDPRDGVFVNRLTTPGSGSNDIQCFGHFASNDADNREGPFLYTQGGTLHCGFNATLSNACLWLAWDENGTRRCSYKSSTDPTAANRLWCEDALTGNVTFFAADGNTVIASLDRASNQWSFPRTTGTQPFAVTSTTEVPNLNAQLWHGKQALDFSAALDFASIPAQSCAELTLTATGATVNSPITASWPSALEANLAGSMRVSATGTIAVRLCNVSASAIDPVSQTFAGRIIQ